MCSVNVVLCMMEAKPGLLVWLGSKELELTRRNYTMSREDQERFEDYLELETFIEKLQAGHVAHPPRELTLIQARIYLIAVLFHSTSPKASGLRKAFANALQIALKQELQQLAKKQHLPLRPGTT